MRSLLLCVLAVVVSSNDAGPLPQPEVEFEDGTTPSMILTKPDAQQELVVQGCARNVQPRLCELAEASAASTVSTADNAAAIEHNAAAIFQVADRVEKLRQAMLAEDASLRAAVILMRTELSQVRSENRVLRETIVALGARVSVLDSKHTDAVNRLDQLHQNDADTLRQLAIESRAADDRLQAAIKAVRKMEGPKGERGDTGAKGEVGAKGERGSTGNIGSKGQKGATGATGATGKAGKTGQAGQAGKAGAKGAKGEAGTNATNNPTPSPTPSPTPGVVVPAFKNWQRSDKFIFWRQGPGGMSRMDFTMAPGYAWGKQNDGAVYDLGRERAAGNAWTLRFKLHLTKFGGGSTQLDAIGIGLTSSHAFDDLRVCQSSVSFNVGISSAIRSFYVHAAGQDTQQSCAFGGKNDVARFATPPQQGSTISAELVRSGGRITGRIYKDSSYTTIASQVQTAVGGHVGSLRYIAIKGLGQTARGYAAGFNFLSGWIDDVSFNGNA